MNIREAIITDLSAICVIVADDYQMTGPVDVAPMDNRALVETMAGLIESPGACVLVAESDGDVMGVAAFALGGFMWRPSVVNAVEAAWAVRDDLAGTVSGNKLMIRLADEMIKQAKDAGATMFTLGGNIKFPSVVKMLERRHGLKARETLCAGGI